MLKKKPRDSFFLSEAFGTGFVAGGMTLVCSWGHNRWLCAWQPPKRLVFELQILVYCCMSYMEKI